MLRSDQITKVILQEQYFAQRNQYALVLVSNIHNKPGMKHQLNRKKLNSNDAIATDEIGGSNSLPS